MIRLLVQTPEEYLRFALPPERDLFLGSSPDNDICLPVKGVSRQHARLRLEDSLIKVWDLESKNGLFVGSDRVQAALLEPTSTPVQVGEVLLQIEDVSESDESLAIELVEGPLEDGPPAEVRLLSRARKRSLESPGGMIWGPSATIQSLLEQLGATVDSWLDVLLLGESGTGKELFAQLIHRSGPTSGGPFVAINCAAIPRELLEAELFGVEARVATGVDPRPGHFLEADGGSIFLDEIGEMPEALQVKLLRAVQEREVLAVGSTKPRRIRVRIIAASNLDIPLMARKGRFRTDLYYRLRGLEFRLPPLRERRADIPTLVEAFVQQAARSHDKEITGVSRRALRFLMEYSWPGNVRELKAEVERAVLICPSGGILESSHFDTLRRWMDPEREAGPGNPAGPEPPTPASPTAGAADSFPKLDLRIEDVERRAIREALFRTGGNKSAAARLLGITRNGLALKMKRLSLEG